MFLLSMNVLLRIFRVLLESGKITEGPLPKQSGLDKILRPWTTDNLIPDCESFIFLTSFTEVELK